jgi:hypothetical protein
VEKQHREAPASKDFLNKSQVEPDNPTLIPKVTKEGLIGLK